MLKKAIYNNLAQLKVKEMEIDYHNHIISVMFTDSDGEKTVCEATIMPSVDARTGIWSLHSPITNFDHEPEVIITENLVARLKFIAKKVVEHVMEDVDGVGTT